MLRNVSAEIKTKDKEMDVSDMGKLQFFAKTWLVKYGLVILFSYVIPKWKFLNFLCVFLLDWFENQNHRRRSTLKIYSETQVSCQYININEYCYKSVFPN